MQENEFEKRVREEMGELRLRPSEMVWDKVDAQLKRKKKRRVVFFIFLLAGLSLLGSGGYFIYRTNEKQNLVEQNIKAEGDNTTNINETNENDEAEKATRHQKDNLLRKSSATDQKTETKEQHITNKNGEKIGTPAKNDQSNEIVAADKKKTSSGKVTIPSSKQIVTVKKERNKFQHVPSAKGKKPAANKNIDDNENVIAQQKKKDVLKDKPSIVDDKNIVADKAADKIGDESHVTEQKQDEITKAESNIVSDKPADKISIEKSVAEQNQNEIAKTDSAIASIEVKKPEKSVEQKTKKSPSAIKWGIDISAGSSNIGENAFSISIFESIFENKSMADVMYNTPGNSTGGQARIITPPSDVKRGTAFKAGIVVEKNISKKSSVSAGLSYVYYSNSIKTGVYKDSNFVLRNMAMQAVSLDAYYQGPQQREYTNRYHFIQLPVYYQLQLNKGVKTPLLWNAGVSAGYLLNTNALVYDTAAGGIYYRDKDAFSKMHLNINTGFAFRFGNKKIQYSIGPELSMDMRRLMKDATQPKQYFLYGGLTGRVLFTKKK